MTIAKCIFLFILLPISINKVIAVNDSLSNVYFHQAEEFKKQSKSDSAIIYFEKAAIGYKENNNIEQFVNSYNQIGIILTRQDKYEKAKEYLTIALNTGLAELDPNNLNIATSYITFGVIYNAEDKYDESIINHNKALSIRLKVLGENNSEVATSYGNIGNVHFKNKAYQKALDGHLKALRIREKLYGSKGREVYQSYNNLGKTYTELNDYETALTYYEKAWTNWLEQQKYTDADLIKLYKEFSDICYKINKSQRGDYYKEKAKALENK